jgi:putative toxin-antitoxin system antitoxin component (TIGR02293 family)
MSKKPKIYPPVTVEALLLREGALSGYIPELSFSRVFEIIGMIYPKGKSTTESDLIPIIRKGLAKKHLESLMMTTGLNLTAMAHILHVSERTMHRYAKDTLLNPEISERLLEIAKLYAKGQDVFGGLEPFKKWLQDPVIALGNKKPLDFLDTSIGIRLLEDELGRIEHGIFS